ncbi:GNAT family N-acetyltransferase [Anaerolineales bacterium HSG6]|nr:GNAT family N-acetyltransferase [Anaerolineales bacterium HSG6]MDM8530661.1 GNAT family N-acetyltransferase [Anaerolineales bacterium HSG25]
MEIREIRTSDTQAFLNLRQLLDRETHFMMLEPGERKTNLAEQQQEIEQILATPNQTILVAEVEGGVVGYIRAMGGAYNRNRHCASVVVGVLQVFTGLGLGKRLFIHLDEWAQTHGIQRLELTVMVDNHAASAVYHRMGFEIEGFRRQALLVDGRYVDEYYMAKILDSK